MMQNFQTERDEMNMKMDQVDSPIFHIERPEEPAQINWMNLPIKTSEKVVRASLVMLFISLLLYLFSYEFQ